MQNEYISGSVPTVCRKVTTTSLGPWKVAYQGGRISGHPEVKVGHYPSGLYLLRTGGGGTYGRKVTSGPSTCLEKTNIWKTFLYWGGFIFSRPFTLGCDRQFRSLLTRSLLLGCRKFLKQNQFHCDRRLCLGFSFRNVNKEKTRDKVS